MPKTLNDFGDTGVWRVEQQGRELAAKIGVPHEVLFGYFNSTGHWPMSIAELEAWGNTPDRIYGIRRRTDDGVWHPITQGMQTPGKSDQDRAGFMGANGETGHIIHNAEDSAIQRFQTVDDQGNVWGGSWNPQANQAHPEWTGKTGMQLASAALGQGPTVRTAATNPYPPGSSLAATWESANPDAGAAPAPTPTSAGGVSPGATGATSGADPSLGGPGGVGFNSAAASAANNAVLAWLSTRRLQEVEIPELALKTETQREQLRQDLAKQVWLQAYQTAQLTGKAPDGTSTLDAQKLDEDRKKLVADLTGQAPDTGIAGRAAAAFARARATNPAITGGGPEAGAIWQSLAPGLTPAQGAQMASAAHAYYATNGVVMPDDVARSALGQITGRPASDFGTLTPDAQRVANDTARVANDAAHQTNQDAIAALNVLSTLRGPENAFVYAQTLANLPESVKATIQQMTQHLPVTSGLNPAQRGVLGDVGALGGQGAPLGTGPTATGQPATTSPIVPGQTTTMPLVVDPAARTGAVPGALESASGRGPTMSTQSIGGAVPMSPAGTLLGMSGATPTVNPTQGTVTDTRTAGVGAGAGDLRTASALPPSHAAAAAPDPRGPTAHLASLPVASRGLIPGVSAAPPVNPTVAAPGGVPISAGSRPGSLSAALGAGAQPPPLTVAPGNLGALATGPAPIPGVAPPTHMQPGATGPLPAVMRGLPVAARPLPGATAPAILAPGQLSPTEMARTSNYGREMLWSGYEAGGYDRKDAQDQYLRSLPVSSGPRRGVRRAA